MGWNLTQALTQTQTQTQMDVVDQGVQYIAESSMLLFVLVCPCLSIGSHQTQQPTLPPGETPKEKEGSHPTNKNKTSDTKLNKAPTKSKKPSSPQVCRISPGPGGSSTTKAYPANSSVSLNSSAAFALAEDREGLLITQSLTF